MIRLWRALGQLRSSHPADAEAVERPTPSKLLQLPPELSNHRWSWILGPSVWTSLQDEARDAKLAFLTSLAIDLPQHFICYTCVCLHRGSSIQWPRTITDCCKPRCMFSGRGYSPRFLSRYKVYFPHIQLAMKQHYCGVDLGFPLEAFSIQRLSTMTTNGQSIFHISTPRLSAMNFCCGLDYGHCFPGAGAVS